MELPGLSFDLGLAMQERIRHRFASLVTHHALDRFSFILVAAFGRCKFKLSIKIVELLLQAALGGLVAQFFVSRLGERTFKFAVSSKKVGLFFASLQFFSCDTFKVFFFLWGNGGPNWKLEYLRFCQEEDNSWSTPKLKSRVVVHDASHLPILHATPLVHLSGANAVPIGLGNRGASASLADQPPGADMAGDRRPHFLSGANTTKLGRGRTFHQLVSSYADKAKAPVSDDIVQAQASATSSFPRRLPLTSQTKLAAWEETKQTRHCARCLANDHRRVNCIQPIRCHACHSNDHVAARCPSLKSPARQQNLSAAYRAQFSSRKKAWQRMEQPARLSARGSNANDKSCFSGRAMNNNNTTMGLQPNNGEIALEHREGDINTPPNPSSWQLYPSNLPSSSGSGATVA